MKNFYTDEDLRNLKAEELLEICTFGNKDTVLYYEDLLYMRVNSKGDYSFFMQDITQGEGGTREISTTSRETYNNVVLGRARYLLLNKRLKKNSEIKKQQESYFKEIKSFLEKIETQNNTAITSRLKEQEVLIKEIKKLNKKANSTIDDLEIKYNQKLQELNVLDVSKYEKRMTALDKIIDTLNRIFS